MTAEGGFKRHNLQKEKGVLEYCTKNIQRTQDVGWNKPIPLACEKRLKAVQLEPICRWKLTIADAQLEDSGSN